MSNQKKYRALVIGAGRIASGYDNAKSTNILTHAHAFKAYPKIEFLGFYDIDQEKARQAAKKWEVEVFVDLDKAIVQNRPEIISICTPDDNHFAQLKKLADLKIKSKIIICEKPITTRINDTKKIIDRYRKIGVPVSVDHSRRFDKVVQNAAKTIKEGHLGKIIYSSAVYGQGILHSGSHIIDLARFFFGEVRNSRPLFKRNDYKKEDQTLGVFLEFQNCEQFYLIAGDCRQYDLFEFDIVGEKGRICFTDLGFKYFEQKVIADPVFKGYKILSQPAIKKTNLEKAMLNLVDNAVQHIEIGQPLICDLADAAKTQKTCLSINNNSKGIK